MKQYGVAISGLGYYPNPLDPDPAHRQEVIGHLKKVISAAPKLGVGVVNTFIGRDWTKSDRGQLADGPAKSGRTSSGTRRRPA